MNYAADVIIIIFAFAAFGYSHSLLASRKIKKLASDILGDMVVFYRLIYNLVSILSIYLIYLILPQPDLLIYDLPYPWDFIILVPQLLSLAGIIWSFSYIDFWEFTGIKQIKRWSEEKEYKESTGLTGLIISGPYRFSRHPIYMFSILFLLFQPSMNLFYLTLFICITLYFYVGSVYEEIKLTEEFGESYITYRERVPRIFPIKLRK